jgi:colanic acid/amylovoran biosynthesis protein
LAAIVWRLDPDDRRLVRAHVALLARADLVIATGMGGITDVFPRYASELLETMAAAQRGGAATAMVGQGLGPIGDPRLLKDAAEVLRNVDLIGLREERAGRPLLQRLGVSLDRTLTTGDDAIELALDRVPAQRELGRAIGVNVRLSDYSALTAAAAAGVARAVAAAGRRLAVPLQPIAISAVPGEEDAAALAELFDGVEDVGALEVPTLNDVLAATARCRVVVTGSYHAAVFALSIGVPAIGLAASRYYEDKFLGLAEQFGEGCDVVMLGGRGVDDLAGTIAEAWARAPALRSPLRDAGVRQVARGHEAYDRVAALVHSRSDIAAPVGVSS